MDCTKKEVIMTEITIEEALKSKQKFSEFMSDFKHPIIDESLKEYQIPNGKVVLTIAELTQNYETFGKLIEDPIIENLVKSPYIVWIVVNEKEHILKQMAAINKYSTSGFGIFVFKLVVNDDKTEIKCLLKPQIQEKKVRAINTNTPAKQLQLDYWQTYFEKCDELQSEMQINPAPRHYQYIGIGKKGVQIMQTVSTVDKYIATELSINNDKSIFYKLEESKEKIEEELGILEWHIKDGVDSCKIRQKIYYDISMLDIRESKAEEHIKLAEDFKKVFSKYL